MDKRIAIAIMAVLLLVVTAAYAPNTGSSTTDTTVTTDDQTTLQTIDKKLDTVLSNQKLILERITALETGQVNMEKDIKYIRSKTR
jgi:peptidoglycan hydrolase CwlO-like protein